MALTDSKVIVSGLSSQQRPSIQSIPKTGGSTVTLVENSNLNSMAVRGSDVFYGIANIGLGGVQPYQAVAIRDDGTNKLELLNTQLPTMALPPGSFATTSVEGRPQDLIRKLLLVDRASPATPILKVLDTATRTTTTLGSLSDGLESFFVFGLEEILLGSFGRAAAPNEPDVYFMNAAIPNSLVRVTNTVGRAENAIPFYGF